MNQFGQPTHIALPNCQDSHYYGNQNKQVPRWSPYDFNGGNVAAIGLPEGLVMCADTRLTRGYSILSRKETKIHKLTDTCYILSTGCFSSI